ncbi:MAG: bifunctional metallophosphatase/5'-nucleotidase [Lachnospiraceae bacterium]|jgi:5'-nucleotidase/UDP-sugar diphosphatase
MKIGTKMKIVMLTAAIQCTLCAGVTLASENGDADLKEEVQILFTHDMHSHLDPYKAEKDGETVMIGGFAKLKTMAEEKRAACPATFLVDGGDFSMGTLYQTIYETEAPELTMMGQIGYDAVTLGNHEFDYRSQGLANMLHAAKKHEKEHPDESLPALVSANIDWTKNTSEDNLLVKEAMETYGSRPYIVIERGGIKVGIFGVLGKDADECAPESGLEFEDIVETSRQVAEQLQKEQADLIICLSHSGTSEKEDKSEDEILAQKVPEIDIIISGHTHTTLENPIQHGDTYVVSAGSYCENLGELHLTRKENGRWNLEEYRLNPLDETVKEEPQIKAQLGEYKQIVNEEYLARFGYTFDQVLAENPVEFTQIDEFAETLEEDPLGSIIADSYVYAVQKAEGEHYEKVYVTISPSGAIRDTFQQGAITVSDAFNVSSLGIGADRIPGYPLVSVYLTGREIKTAAEIDASISPIMTSAQLYPSGLRWTYNPNRMLLNKVTDVEFVTNVPYTEGKETEEIVDDQLYRVVAGLYSAQMLGAIEDSSMGLLKIMPKDKNGQAIEDFEQHIIHDQNGAEVKEWYALASYLESFEQNEEGVSEIPSYYEEAEGRKQRDDSRSLADILKQPNRFAWIVYGGILILILLTAGIVGIFIKKRKKHRKKLER